MAALASLAATRPTTSGDLLLMGAAFLVVGVSTFALPQLYDASVRFSHRLMKRSTDEDRAVRRNSILRRILGVSFVIVGSAMVLAGLGAL